MRSVTISLRRIIGLVWCLSWFELYLEIFRHHHVNVGLLLHPALWFAATSSAPQPGGWLQTVLVCSAAAPILFLALVAWSESRRRARGPLSLSNNGRALFTVASAAAAFGVLLCVLATINQLIRRDPLEFDLTLTRGNGGFIVVGAGLAVAGLVLRRRRRTIA